VKGEFLDHCQTCDHDILRIGGQLGCLKDVVLENMESVLNF